MKLTAAEIEAAFFAKPKAAHFFAHETSFEELCRLEDGGGYRFELRMDDPVVRVHAGSRALLSAWLAPRILDDAAVHARCMAASERLEKGLLRLPPCRPLALLVGARCFVLELDRERVWQPATEGVALFARRALAGSG